MEKCILQTDHLTKSYKNYKALENISVSLKEGKIYGLIGKNGAGDRVIIRPS